MKESEGAPVSAPNGVAEVADISDDCTEEQNHAKSLAEKHRAGTLAALAKSTSDEARKRHARKSWGGR